MFNKKEKIIILVISFISVFLLFYRVGELNKKIDQQKIDIQDSQNKINKSIANLENAIKKPRLTQGDDITTEFAYSFNKFDKNKKTVVANFSVTPKEYSKNLKVYISSNGQSQQLKNTEYFFTGSKEFSLNDNFINLISYDLDGLTRTDAVRNDIYNTKIGELILPKYSLDTREMSESLENKKLKTTLSFKLMITPSREQYLDNKNQKKAGYDDFEVIAKKNGVTVKEEKFDLNNPSTLADYHKINFEIDYDKSDDIEIFYRLVDDYGLVHKKIISSYKSMERVYTSEDIKVYVDEKEDPIYNY